MLKKDEISRLQPRRRAPSAYVFAFAFESGVHERIARIIPGLSICRSLRSRVSWMGRVMGLVEIYKADNALRGMAV